ncbi:hypothetical protein B0O80DRAFT_427844 [Mortierella sp. GBAus27b]|nr:hypothetical protein B0O80DRAFT_427844 [Mortierella sp. GBAus27b]
MSEYFGYLGKPTALVSERTHTTSTDMAQSVLNKSLGFYRQKCARVAAGDPDNPDYSDQSPELKHSSSLVFQVQVTPTHHPSCQTAAPSSPSTCDALTALSKNQNLFLMHVGLMGRFADRVDKSFLFWPSHSSWTVMTSARPSIAFVYTNPSQQSSASHTSRHNNSQEDSLTLPALRSKVGEAPVDQSLSFEAPPQSPYLQAQAWPNAHEWLCIFHHMKQDPAVQGDQGFRHPHFDLQWRTQDVGQLGELLPPTYWNGDKEMSPIIPDRA